MNKNIILASLFILGSASTSLAGPDCTCRYKGQDIPEGQQTCIKTANGYKIAKCARVLNNTSWKITKKTCPIG